MMYFCPPPAAAVKVEAEKPRVQGAWSDLEHKRFLIGLDLHPKGPWKAIASFKLFRKMRLAATSNEPAAMAQHGIMALVKHEIGSLAIEPLPFSNACSTADGNDATRIKTEDSMDDESLPSLDECVAFFYHTLA
ncbi:hypothetical protein SPRG_13462 [Saprolegnia parasitica CBS 223.65]|uniref:Myb-like domain-containing protein n=1 Tax=Saprolegnia parasitica (strain CBS 223.65) TaxID=695850 RepID=A0A067BPQ0_SAPPC|nr:hypothetical protein SPRG_13462 [Saprolegnia parasitica CBS 223.65]KDO20208.1 hypothetical protein SPRG_13462 [Saprolegnia parasitica CBS 223.65]|eukprot:XP_012209095.1 hypothetical protein SPRG_13462 [Saprolegnia parasitica CBS 223.65]